MLPFFRTTNRLNIQQHYCIFGCLSISFRNDLLIKSLGSFQCQTYEGRKIPRNLYNSYRIRDNCYCWYWLCEPTPDWNIVQNVDIKDLMLPYYIETSDIYLSYILNLQGTLSQDAMHFVGYVNDLYLRVRYSCMRMRGVFPLFNSGSRPSEAFE